MLKARRNMGWVLALGLLVFTTSAKAGTFNVNPIRIQFTPDKLSELLSVRNTSKEEMRFQVETFSWKQAEDGKIILTPTEDLIFFPRMIKIPAGEERKIRVGLAPKAARPSAQNVTFAETTYRIIVQELPSRKTVVDRSQIQVLARMSIPIFVTPNGAKPQVVIVAGSTHGDRIQFQMKNVGRAATMVNELHVTVLDANRRTLLSSKLPSWYLLARDVRNHELALPVAICNKARSFQIAAKTTEKTIHQDYQPSQPLSCVPSQVDNAANAQASDATNKEQGATAPNAKGAPKISAPNKKTSPTRE